MKDPLADLLVKLMLHIYWDYGGLFSSANCY